MQEIITAFGIDWRLIVIQMFNFVLLLALLWYFLYKPVLALIKERQEKIAQGVRDADAATAKLAKAEEEKGEVLRAAHTESETIVQRAREHAAQKADEISRIAQEKSARLLLETEEKAKEALLQAKRESETEIAKLAVLSAEKILRDRTGKQTTS